MNSLKPLLAALLLLPGLALAAETGTALRDDTLRKEPYADAKSAGTLKRNDKVDIIGKQGAWLQVKTRQASGWVRLLSVRRTGGSSNEALGLASGRTGTGQVVSTTGVRGLNEEDLKSAKFNAEEIKQLEADSVSADEGRKLADAGGLKSRKLDYLPAPATSSGGAK